MRRTALALWLAAAASAVAAPVASSSSSSSGAADDDACRLIGSVWGAASDLCICAPCDLCHFVFSAWECQRTPQDAVLDASDGTSEPVEQPQLAADKWFLTDDEMTASRGGVARNGLQLWTPRNNVTTFAATSEYYDAVYADLEATKPHEHVWITGWSFSDVALQPQVTPDELNATKVVAVMQRLADKQVDLHVLGWTNFMESSQNRAFQKQVNALPPGPPQGDAYFVFDDRLPDATASHHQKTVAIKRGQGIVAYVGGVDLTWDRWDTLQHDQTELRQRTGIELEGGSHGWMDAQLKIDGPAASDVATNFLQRWNMKRKPLQDLLDPLFPYKNPEYSSLAALNEGEPLVERTTGHHNVQVVRTYSCKYSHYDEFAPKGEVSIFHSRLKAIKMAKNYIYIEDQYFIHVSQLMDALTEVLPRLQRLIIVTQPAGSDTSKTGYRKYQYEMLQPLQAKFPNKVQVYRTKPARDVYIHTKMLVIDDVFLSISSSNWNRRSMTTDTEIGANVVDSDVVKTPDGVNAGRIVRDYRVRKFEELTGKSYAELDKMALLDAFQAVADAAQQPNTLIETYEAETDASFIVFTDTVQEIADPLDECKSLRRD